MSVPRVERGGRPAGWAVVRLPGDSFARAVSNDPGRGLIDPGLARAQHARYCRLLEEAGLELIRLPADEDHPDACFTQDPAVVLGSHALLCRFGEPTRRGEEAALRGVLQPLLETVESLAAPATLEGGDVLVFGRRIVVGQSRRTNPAGIQALARWAEPLGYRVCPAAVPGWALHLGTSASVLTDSLVLGSAEALGQPAFDGLERVVVPDEDPRACNVVAVGEVLIAAGTHGVHRELQRRGFTVRATDLTEFNRADGSPTCLSLLVDLPNPSSAGSRAGPAS